MISITSETIDICKVLLDTMDNSEDGTVLFIGSVRDHNEDGTVSEIYYEAYKEMAEKNLTEIEIEARKKWNIKKFVAAFEIRYEGFFKKISYKRNHIPMVVGRIRIDGLIMNNAILEYHSFTYFLVSCSTLSRSC